MGYMIKKNSVLCPLPYRRLVSRGTTCKVNKNNFKSISTIYWLLFVYMQKYITMDANFCTLLHCLAPCPSEYPQFTSEALRIFIWQQHLTTKEINLGLTILT